jgi:hypothetical protein
MEAEVYLPLSQESSIAPDPESQPQIFVRIHCFRVSVLKFRWYVLEAAG